MPETSIPHRTRSPPASKGSSNATAKRAMSVTEEWKPTLDRRQSWNKEDHKHAMQMSFVQDVKTGQGFTEKN